MHEGIGDVAAVSNVVGAEVEIDDSVRLTNWQSERHREAWYQKIQIESRLLL